MSELVRNVSASCCEKKRGGRRSAHRCEENQTFVPTIPLVFLFHRRLLLFLHVLPPPSSFISSLSPSFAPSSSSSPSLKLLTQLDGIKCSISSTCSISLKWVRGWSGYFEDTLVFQHQYSHYCSTHSKYYCSTVTYVLLDDIKPDLSLLNVTSRNSCCDENDKLGHQFPSEPSHCPPSCVWSCFWVSWRRLSSSCRICSIIVLMKSMTPSMFRSGHWLCVRMRDPPTY